jgi:hypothetical protein
MDVAGHRFPLFKGAPLPDTWAGALGTALRGIIPRGEDTIVSLMPVGTEALFREKQLAAFASFWGKTVAAVLTLTVVVFTGIFALAASMRKHLIETLAVQRRSENVVVAQSLSDRAKAFNELVERVREALTKRRTGEDQLKFLFDMAAGTSVTLERISVQLDTNYLEIHARAPDRAAALAFKNKFDASGKFSSVDFPIASIIETPPTGVTFVINLTLK